MSGLTKLFSKKESIGAAAEKEAQHYLEDHGLTFIERNYRCKQGEIDLIMQDNDTLVFVEVRFRRSKQFGSAVETVTSAKQRKIMLATQHYMLEHQLGENFPMRFDVIGLDNETKRWIKNAF